MSKFLFHELKMTGREDWESPVQSENENPVLASESQVCPLRRGQSWDYKTEGDNKEPAVKVPPFLWQNEKG